MNTTFNAALRLDEFEADLMRRARLLALHAQLDYEDAVSIIYRGDPTLQEKMLACLELERRRINGAKEK